MENLLELVCHVVSVFCQQPQQSLVSVPVISANEPACTISRPLLMLLITPVFPAMTCQNICDNEGHLSPQENGYRVISRHVSNTGVISTHMENINRNQF